MWKREPGASRRQPKTPRSFGSEGVSNICSPRVWCRKNGPTEVRRGQEVCAWWTLG